MNVLLIDDTPDRRSGIKSVFENCGWNTVEADETAGAPALDTFNLLILHQQAQNFQGGNDGSLEFLSNFVTPSKELAVIGYTGGNATDNPQPNKYRAFPDYCIFLNEVNSADSACFGVFATAWAESPDEAPPFHLLRPRIPYLHHTLAAYLLQSANMLDDTANIIIQGIKKKADAESKDDYCASIDNYFGFKSPRILRLTEPGIRALSLRAKVSHSLIEHEVLQISEDDAVARVPATWVEIEKRWATLYELALEFGRVIPEISASALVDELKALTVLSGQTRGELKRRLDALNGKANGQSLYSDRLDKFWSAAKDFFDLLKQGAGADKIRIEWRRVRERADDLKALFRDGTIPDGIPLP